MDKQESPYQFGYHSRSERIAKGEGFLIPSSSFQETKGENRHPKEVDSDIVADGSGPSSKGKSSFLQRMFVSHKKARKGNVSKASRANLASKLSVGKNSTDLTPSQKRDRPNHQNNPDDHIQIDEPVDEVNDVVQERSDDEDLIFNKSRSDFRNVTGLDKLTSFTNLRVDKRFFKDSNSVTTHGSSGRSGSASRRRKGSRPKSVGGSKGSAGSKWGEERAQKWRSVYQKPYNLSKNSRSSTKDDHLHPVDGHYGRKKRINSLGDKREKHSTRGSQSTGEKEVTNTRRRGSSARRKSSRSRTRPHSGKLDTGILSHEDASVVSATSFLSSASLSSHAPNSSGAVHEKSKTRTKSYEKESRLRSIYSSLPKETTTNANSNRVKQRSGSIGTGGRDRISNREGKPKRNKRTVLNESGRTAPSVTISKNKNHGYSQASHGVEGDEYDDEIIEEIFDMEINDESDDDYQFRVDPSPPPTERPVSKKERPKSNTVIIGSKKKNPVNDPVRKTRPLSSHHRLFASKRNGADEIHNAVSSFFQSDKRIAKRPPSRQRSPFPVYLSNNDFKRENVSTSKSSPKRNGGKGMINNSGNKLVSGGETRQIVGSPPKTTKGSNKKVKSERPKTARKRTGALGDTTLSKGRGSSLNLSSSFSAYGGREQLSTSASSRDFQFGNVDESPNGRSQDLYDLEIEQDPFKSHALYTIPIEITSQGKTTTTTDTTEVAEAMAAGVRIHSPGFGSKGSSPSKSPPPVLSFHSPSSSLKTSPMASINTASGRKKRRGSGADSLNHRESPSMSPPTITSERETGRDNGRLHSVHGGGGENHEDGIVNPNVIRAQTGPFSVMTLLKHYRAPATAANHIESRTGVLDDDMKKVYKAPSTALAVTSFSSLQPSSSSNDSSSPNKLTEKSLPKSKRDNWFAPPPGGNHHDGINDAANVGAKNNKSTNSGGNTMLNHSSPFRNLRQDLNNSINATKDKTKMNTMASAFSPSSQYRSTNPYKNRHIQENSNHHSHDLVLDDIDSSSSDEINSDIEIESLSDSSDASHRPDSPLDSGL
eukprot:g3681.t1